MHPPPADPLPRVLGPWTAAAVVVGTVIGSGVFKKAQAVTQATPEAGVALAAWVFGGVLALLGALALAECAVRLPRAGGNYVYLRDGYGRWAGFLWGWGEFWIIRTASIAALAGVFTDSLHDLLRQMHPSPAARTGVLLDFWARQWVTLAAILALAWVNVRGTRWGGRLQLALTLVKVGSLLALVALPAAALAFATDPAARPDPARLDPLWPAGGAFDIVRFGGALVGVLWAYHGWMNVAPIAGEVRDPQRNVPRAVIGGVLAVTALYVSVNLAYYLVLPRAEIASASDTTVAARFCDRLLGPMGTAVASAAVMVSAFGALNGNLLVGPRLLYAMGADGLAPRWLSALDPRTGTPAAAVAAMAGWSCLMTLGVAWAVDAKLPVVAAGKPPFDVATDFAMFGAVALETLAVAAVFVFRRGRVGEPAYLCPGYPWVPAVYVMAMTAVLVTMFMSQPSEARAGVAFLTAGGAVYLAAFAGRARPAG